MEEAKKKTHQIIMENRKALFVSGVKDVEAFDERKIELFTQEGALIVKGAQLHISKMNIEIGEIQVDGSVDSLTYEDRERSGSESFLSKLFK